MSSGIGTAAAIAVFGLGTLGGLRAGAGPAATQVAVVAMPWQTAGLVWAGSFDLPIVDLFWEGRVVVLDLSANAAAADRLRGTGIFLLDASFVKACLGTDLSEDLARDRK